MQPIERLNQQIIACTKCPRLVEHRETVARAKRRMYLDWDYWGRPVPGFGDPHARVMIVGLAPAAHGANRTGRLFTGDRSGDWLYDALHRHGFANQATSKHRDDGLVLNDVYVTAAIRCAPPGNKPSREELFSCRPYLLEELELVNQTRIVLALGKVAFDYYLTAYREVNSKTLWPIPVPRFGHGSLSALPTGIQLMASYHPSQQNTQTGKLTHEMFDSIFAATRRLLDSGQLLA